MCFSKMRNGSDKDIPAENFKAQGLTMGVWDDVGVFVGSDPCHPWDWYIYRYLHTFGWCLLSKWREIYSIPGSYGIKNIHGMVSNEKKRTWVRDAKQMGKWCIFKLDIPSFWGTSFWDTPRKFNIAAENRPSQEELVFQPSFFRGYVKFRGCIYPKISKLLVITSYPFG